MSLTINFSDVLKALNQDSAYELYRMRAAIDIGLDEPGRVPLNLMQSCSTNE
jgi:hypothetical protein